MYLWSGWKLLVELDGRSGQSPDREGVGQAARTIGGLLATEKSVVNSDNQFYFYCYDANAAFPGGLVARYEYDPYGVIIGPDTNADGEQTNHRDRRHSVSADHSESVRPERRSPQTQGASNRSPRPPLHGFTPHDLRVLAAVGR